jgi:subtilisin
VRHRLVVVVAIAAIVGGLGVGAGARGAPPGRYIVLLKDSVASPAAVARAHATAHRAQVGFVYTAAVKGYSATLSAPAVGALRADPQVAAVVADREVHLAAQTLPTGINRVDGERSSTVSGNGSGSVNVDIAIIDTGIDTSHPDLNVVGGVACNGSGYQDGHGHGTTSPGSPPPATTAPGWSALPPGPGCGPCGCLTPRGRGRGPT